MLSTLREIQKVLAAGCLVTLCKGMLPREDPYIECRVTGPDGKGSALQIIDVDLLEQFMDPNRDALGEVVASCYQNYLRAKTKGGTL